MELIKMRQTTHLVKHDERVVCQTCQGSVEPHSLFIEHGERPVDHSLSMRMGTLKGLCVVFLGHNIQKWPQNSNRI